MIALKLVITELTVKVHMKAIFGAPAAELDRSCDLGAHSSR